jgi:hypothetical protein
VRAHSMANDRRRNEEEKRNGERDIAYRGKGGEG